MQNPTSHGFRISLQQKQIWLAQQAFPSQPLRAVAIFNIEGDLDRNRLEQTLNLVVSRHEILRTTFDRPPGIKLPFQVVSERTNIFQQYVDLTNPNEEQQQERMDALFAAECKRPLTLSDGPSLHWQFAALSSSRSDIILSLAALCADSQTLKNLATKIFRAYESTDELPAEDEVAQYADFAEWQSQFPESGDEQALANRTYWNEKQRAGLAPALPLERRSVAGRIPEYESVTWKLGEELLNQLEVIASENNATLTDVLFVCWQALISRFCGLDDFVIYKRCDGRTLDDLNAALGPFDRYLPIRCDSGNSLLASQMSRTIDELRQAEEAQDYADVDNPDLLRGNAIAFEFEERPAFTTRTLSVSLTDLYVFSNHFKLKLSCILSGNQLSLQLQYDTATFYRETCERFSGYLRRLIEAVATTTPAVRANLTLDSIDVLPEDERRCLLVDLNDTATSYSQDKCVHELFEAQAERTPAATAVVCGDEQLTYEELNIRANQFANLLRQHGVGPNACVGMCLSGSVDLMVVLLGILKAGAAYVPMDPEHPVVRLTAQLRKAQACVCVTNVTTLAESLGSYTTVIDLAKDRELVRTQPSSNPPAVVSPESLAYVINTSGSTGEPKGVAVRHRNLVNYAESILKRLGVEKPLHFATVSAISADLGNTCIFPSLFSGGCLHIIGPDVVLEPRLFSEYLSHHQIDVLKITPSHLHALMSDNEALPSKYLVLGGEAFSRQLLDSILATPHSCKVINHYGPTETTVGSLTFEASGKELSDLVRTVPVGRPLANTRVYILDQHLRPTPLGVAGELYIGGDGVAVGYLNDSDLTGARFVSDPFSDEPGSRLYRTGDLARILPDRNIEFLGRSDFQVKVRGHRIELGEVEMALSEHPLIKQAVVMLRGEDGQQQLVAYALSSQLHPANTDEIRQYLKQRLPHYMVPAAIVVLRSFPTTVNGKVDRAALPLGPDTQDRVMIAPQTAVEKELAAIWCELLKISEISVHDNFFDRGGHSLLATQVVSRIKKVFNTNIKLRAIFDSPTIAKLSLVIEDVTYAKATDLQMVLDSLQSLSDEEAERLLKEEEGNRI